jgi:hypothetical protein
VGFIEDHGLVAPAEPRRGRRSLGPGRSGKGGG